MEKVKGVLRENVMTTATAAKRIGITVITLETWIRQGNCPFGVYVKKEGHSYGSYIIIRQRFEKYMSGEDMTSNYKEADAQ